jgi:molybdopterin-guanine dinucleotide biosynthesis protein B
MILGVYGWQDSGKTTLVEKLIKELSAKGYSVSSVKHAPHEKDADAEGKDSWRHLAAGGDPVVLQTADATVLMKRPGLSLEEVVEVVSRGFRPDVLLVEGYKEGDFPKVALGDIEPTEGTVLVNPELADVVEYVRKEVDCERAYEKLPKLDCGKCGLSCVDLAREVAEGRMTVDDCVEMPARRVEIIAGGQRLPVGAFVAEITEKTIRGLLSSLKGYSGDKDVEIRLSSSGDETRND